jgi:hypothetical protein
MIALLFLQMAVATPPNLVVRQGEALKVVPVIGSTTGSYIRADLLGATHQTPIIASHLGTRGSK